MEEEVDGETSTINYDFNSSVTQLSTSTTPKKQNPNAEKGPEVGLGQGQVHAWPLRPPQPSLQVQSADARPRRPPPLRLETRQERVSAVRRVTKKKYCVQPPQVLCLTFLSHSGSNEEP